MGRGGWTLDRSEGLGFENVHRDFPWPPNGVELMVRLTES